MDNKSKELFTASIKQAILQHVGLFESQCESLNGFESIFYKTQLEGEPCALRISHSLHRSPGHIRGEVQWLDHLSQQGIHVPTAITLPCGEPLISISDGQGGAFTAVCFTWAEGMPVWSIKPSPWKAELFEKMGLMTARMHNIAQTFEFPTPCSGRPHWYEQPGMDLRQYLPESEVAIAKKYDRLVHQLQQADQTKADYGLIHYDFHRGNFYLNNGEITLFDFDDAAYHLFIADIAVAVFYAIPFDHPEAHQQSDVAEFFQNFLQGYLRARPIDRKWMSWIPSLLKQRELELYGAMHRSFDLSDPDSLDGWSLDFLEGRKSRILRDAPVIALDWFALYDKVVLQELVTA
jgi:Ser/Thr protein kinase RdoA (MazF antagonist)